MDQMETVIWVKSPRPFSKDAWDSKSQRCKVVTELLLLVDGDVARKLAKHPGHKTRYKISLILGGIF